MPASIKRISSVESNLFRESTRRPASRGSSLSIPPPEWMAFDLTTEAGQRPIPGALKFCHSHIGGKGNHMNRVCTRTSGLICHQSRPRPTHVREKPVGNSHVRHYVPGYSMPALVRCPRLAARIGFKVITELRWNLISPAYPQQEILLVPASPHLHPVRRDGWPVQHAAVPDRRLKERFREFAILSRVMDSCGKLIVSRDIPNADMGKVLQSLRADVTGGLAIKFADVCGQQEGSQAAVPRAPFTHAYTEGDLGRRSRVFKTACGRNQKLLRAAAKS